MSGSALTVDGLEVSVGDLQILKGLNIDVPFGEIHAIMGPNGSGKSTLCHVLTGKSGYQIRGNATVDGQPMMNLEVDERARAGLLQAFQYPVEVPGLQLEVFITEAAEANGTSAEDALAKVSAASDQFGMERFLSRAVNDDLSGGEKKRSELFQLAVLEPKIVILDEIDSGLDIDAVKEVAGAVISMRGDDVGVLIITHYSRILDYIKPDRVHIMMDGRIVDSGGPELADELETGGAARARLGIEAKAPAPAEPSVGDLFTDTPFDL